MRQKERLQFRITGVVPLLLNNDEKANPLSAAAKGIKPVSSKRSKTDEDYELMAKLEWYASLYVKDGQVVMPGMNIEAMLLEAAKKQRKGKQTQAGLVCPDDPPLIYPGPKDIDALWADGGYVFTTAVRIKGVRVMRTRPIFHEWALEFPILFDTGLLNAEEIRQMLEVAGTVVGLGDWRPKFGLFTVDNSSMY